MSWEQIKGDWTQLSPKLKDNWGRLTNDDLVRISGRQDQLIAVLQERYGYARERAETELDRFIRALTS